MTSSPADTETSHGPDDVAGPVCVSDVVELDLVGLKCPLPALRTRRAIRALPPMGRLQIVATDPLSRIDIPNVVREEAASIEMQDWDGAHYRCVISRPA